MGRLLFGIVCLVNLFGLTWLLWFSPYVENSDASGLLVLANFLLVLPAPFAFVVGVGRDPATRKASG